MTIYTTPHYDLRAPNNNENVRNGATAMRNLADDVDTALYDAMQGLPSETNKTIAGSTVVSPDNYGTAAITFPVGVFTTAPVVVVSNGDWAAFNGHVEVVSRLAAGFTIVALTSTPRVRQYIQAYAEWAVNHGETIETSPVNTRMRAGSTGEPGGGQQPTGNIRVNWIAVGS